MSDILHKTHQELLSYLDNPHPQKVQDIISSLKPHKQFEKFVSLFSELIQNPTRELDLISQLDLLFTEHLEKSTQNPSSETPLSQDALEILDDFVEETNEQLTFLSRALQELENNPESTKNYLHSSFQAMHTIKGSAGFLSLKEFTAIAHEAETILGQATSKKHITKTEIYALSAVVEAFEHGVAFLHTTHCIPRLPVQELIASLKKSHAQRDFSKSNTAKTTATIEIFRPISADLSKHSLPILDAFTEEAHELLSNYTLILNEGQKTNITNEREEVFRSIHTLRTNAQALGLSAIPHLAIAAEHLLQESNGSINDEHRETLLSLTDGIERILHNVSLYQRESKETDEEVVERLHKQQTSNTFTIPSTHAPVEQTSFLKVPVQTLNRMMSLSSELIVIKNKMLSLTEKAPPEFEAIYKNLTLLSRELQDEISRTRLQPIAVSFRKVPQIVREASKITGKLVNVLFLGEEQNLDKSLIDQIQEPLLHLVRNAIDHGIEPPTTRETLGKPREGQICLEARSEGGMFILHIHDDGAGVDYEAIVHKAIALGIHSPNQTLSEQQKELLLFHPGLTTKSTISELSGRGMGMDIVYHRINSLRGSIHVHSQPQKGTSIRIQIPLSVQILQTLLIPTPEITLLIPQLRIQEVRSIAPSSIIQIENKHYYKIGSRLLPTVSLSTIFPMSSVVQNLIICTADEQLFGLEVPKIHDFQEVVRQELPKYLSKTHLYQGMTILNSGLPALILNLDHIFQSFNLSGFHKIDTTHAQEDTKIPYLIVSLHSLFAIPLHEIRHIDKKLPENINTCSGWDIFRYAQEDFPLVEIYDIISSKSKAIIPYSFVVLLSKPQCNVGIPVASLNGVFKTAQEIDISLQRKAIKGTIQYQNQPVEVIDSNAFFTHISNSNVTI